MHHCEEAIEQFIDYVRRSIHVEKDGNDCVFTLPFKDPQNDSIEVALSRIDDYLFRFSDMKQCISFLFHNGINVEKDNRYMKRFFSIINEYEFEFKEGEISKTVGRNNDLGSSFLDTIQLILELYGIGIIPESHVDEIPFSSIVNKYFEDNVYDFKRSERIKGKTYEHTINFVLSNGGGPSLVEALSAKSSSDANQKSKLVAFKFFDIKELGNGYKKVALIDDHSPVWKKTSYDILGEYSDYVIPWRDRDELLVVYKG